MSRNLQRHSEPIMIFGPSWFRENSDALIHALDASWASRVESGLKQRSYELVPQSARRVLDVGSGTGDDVLALAERLGPEALVYGLDSRLDLVEEAKRRARGVALNVRFAVGDARCLPFEDGAFDVVRADGLFLGIEDARPVVRELARVLADGGVLLIHHQETLALREPVVGQDETLLRHCQRAGLVATESRPAGPEPGARDLWLVAEKPRVESKREPRVP